MIGKKFANEITEYKIRERLIRRKVLNALLILIEAENNAKELEKEASKGGKLSEVSDFYLSQLEVVSKFYSPLWKIKEEFYLLLLDAQCADPSLFFGNVPEKEKHV